MLSNCIALTLTVGLIYELSLDIKSTAMIGHNDIFAIPYNKRPSSINIETNVYLTFRKEKDLSNLLQLVIEYGLPGYTSRF